MSPTSTLSASVTDFVVRDEDVTRFTTVVQRETAHPDGDDVVPITFLFLAVVPALAHVFGSVVDASSPPVVLHRMHKICLARSLVSGDRISTKLGADISTSMRAQTLVRARSQSFDDRNALVGTQAMTFVVLPRLDDRAIDDVLNAPPIRSSRRARSGAVPVPTVIDDDLPNRYAAVSGDDQSIHLTPTGGQGGTPAILQGMCCLALGIDAVARVAERAPSDASAVAATFVRPLAVPQTMTTHVWDSECTQTHFECTSERGGLLLRAGFVRFRPDRDCARDGDRTTKG
jgi:hypothetical protein